MKISRATSDETFVNLRAFLFQLMQYISWETFLTVIHFFVLEPILRGFGNLYGMKLDATTTSKFLWDDYMCEFHNIYFFNQTDRDK